MPIRTAVSPRARMTKGDEIWAMPATATPLRIVRRSNDPVKLCFAMKWLPGSSGWVFTQFECRSASKAVCKVVFSHSAKPWLYHYFRIRLHACLNNQGGPQAAFAHGANITL